MAVGLIAAKYVAFQKTPRFFSYSIAVVVVPLMLSHICSSPLFREGRPLLSFAYGQDGQVGAGHGSHVGPEGPDQLWVISSSRLSTNINEFQQKVNLLKMMKMKAQ